MHPSWAAGIPGIIQRTDEYKRMSVDGVAASWRLLNSSGWRLEKRGSVKDDVVESTSTKEYGKLYKFTGTVDCPARWLYEDLRERYESLPQWNPTVLQCKTIKNITQDLAIVYQVAAGGGGGLVAARDFVMLRSLCAVDSSGNIVTDSAAEQPAAFLVTGASVEIPECPPVKEYVRGKTKIGNWIMRPRVETIDGKAVERCTFQWLFSCDLKGRLPGFVVDAAMATVMLENVDYIRKHLAQASDKALF